MITGTVKAPQSAAIDVDVRVPDASQQGGVRQEGKVLMDGPGTFQLAVPINQGSVVLQAFQDLNADGPDSSDPFAQVELNVGEEDLQIEMTLEVGAFTMGRPHASRNAPFRRGWTRHRGGSTNPIHSLLMVGIGSRYLVLWCIWIARLWTWTFGARVARHQVAASLWAK